VPIALQAGGNISMVGLIEETGYSALADDVTESVLEKHLRHYPELVPVWSRYSEDQRCTPAFGLSESNEPAKGWRVFYWDHEPASRWHRDFRDEFTACAFFIKRYAESLVSIRRRR
jgi:hypothetical protein